MTQKGLSFTSIVLKVNSPTSIQRNVSRSKGSSVPPEVAFAIANFPHTDNVEMEVENFLEMRLLNVTCESRYNRDERTMTLYLPAQGRDFFSRLSTVNLDLFSDICMEGQLGALELLDVTGAKRALTLPSPTGPTLDPALTPHYEEVALAKKAKLESAGDDGALNIWGQVQPPVPCMSNWNILHASRLHHLLPPPQSTTRLSSMTSSRPSTRMY